MRGKFYIYIYFFFFFQLYSILGLFWKFARIGKLIMLFNKNYIEIKLLIVYIYIL